jgi:hypothetical protein
MMNTDTLAATLAAPCMVERVVAVEAISDGAVVRLTCVLTNQLQRRLDGQW